MNNSIFSLGSNNWKKPYWGYVYKYGFELKRLITYRNFANPQIFGNINPGSNETIISIYSRPEIYSLVFTAIAFVLCLVACIYFLIRTTNGENFYDETLFGAGMCLFIYFFLLVAFKHEATRNKKFLKHLLEVKN